MFELVTKHFVAPKADEGFNTTVITKDEIKESNLV